MKSNYEVPSGRTRFFYLPPEKPSAFHKSHVNSMFKENFPPTQTFRKERAKIFINSS